MGDMRALNEEERRELAVMLDMLGDVCNKLGITKEQLKELL